MPVVQEWRNSIANALELRLSYTNPSTYTYTAESPYNRVYYYTIGT